MSSAAYPEYPASPIELEEQVLERWRAEDLFRRTLEATAGAEEFVFYEGPPTANGRPGIHHVISRAIKDAVCRHRAMQGRHVTRIAGWDTHGLPVEIEAEKKLGISGKRQIEELGVARFNEVCRESVFTYKEDWERLSERIGYWLDYSKPYVTFTPEYIESVWALLERFHAQGLIYRGHKSVPYCPRCGTALSSHEVAQGYEDVSDPSLTFVAPWLEPDGSADPEGRAFLVWTTTPWTLPANAAIAVHPALGYVDLEFDGRRYVVAEARVEALFPDTDSGAGAGADGGEPSPRFVVHHRFTGAELIGRRYARPFDFVATDDVGTHAWTVVPGDFVSDEDGTGLVHVAPAFGSDDFAAGHEFGLPLLRPVDDAGRFAEGLDLVGGMFVKDADPVVVDDLRARGLLFHIGKVVHSYPHCWRCSSPLLYMARDSWYIRTTSVRERMLENNAAVQWHPPEVGSGRMGEWLEGNVDWAISRERYWGTPLPFWVCDADPAHVEAIGSFDQLAWRNGGLPEPLDPHKPYIDELTWSCAECGGTMRRTPEVVDVWFDSGAMPYAQWHWPFENQELFERHFPADFICEGVDQTRGWFYSLLAISSMLNFGPAYRHVVVNDLVLDAEGQKMSKSRGNVVDPWGAIAEFGADAIRWYMLTNSQPWVPKRFDPQALGESARRTFDTLANTYRFFRLYANLESWTPTEADPEPAARPLLDRWILSRCASLAASVNADLEAYELTRAARAIGEFVVDELSNWYVRRSRDRFWGSADAADTRAAFRTLHDVLVTTARLLAPFTPFRPDWLHRALDGDSVHLARYPDGEAFPRDAELERGMEAVRMLARLGRAAREQAKIRVRQPLGVLHAVVPGGVRLDESLLEVARDELNVKRIHFLDDAGELVTFSAKPNFPRLGPRFGRDTQQAAAAIRALDHDALHGWRLGRPIAIEVAGESHELDRDMLEVMQTARGDFLVESDGGHTVALDPAIDEPLRLEGLARELVSRIQRMRKEAGLEVADRIRVAISGDSEVVRAAERYRDWISGETLAASLDTTGGTEAEYSVVQALDLDGNGARIGLSRT
ncbi:MAG TPA: isoleucine--tRNA ligase [Longimicrobiales bacterium]|nr:isoleucine--tRNA ligase [Longimicrobiales bacterium]